LAVKFSVMGGDKKRIWDGEEWCLNSDHGVLKSSSGIKVREKESETEVRTLGGSERRLRIGVEKRRRSSPRKRAFPKEGRSKGEGRGGALRFRRTQKDQERRPFDLSEKKRSEEKRGPRESRSGSEGNEGKNAQVFAGRRLERDPGREKELEKKEVQSPGIYLSNERSAALSQKSSPNCGERGPAKANNAVREGSDGCQSTC